MLKMQQGEVLMNKMVNNRITTPNLTQFTKYDGESSPTNFLAALTGELYLERGNTDANKFFLP